MSREVHAKTKATYEDPNIVDKYFEAYASTLDRVLAGEFVNSLSRGKRVLDLGCGPGHYSGLLSELGADVTGLDYSNAMVVKAREVAAMAKFVVGDMRDLAKTFPENTF